MLKRIIPIVFYTLILLHPCLPLHAVSLSSQVHEYTLKNGLKVLLLERHQSPTISFYLRFKVGSVDEITGQTGTAHLLEHMLFKGTTTLGTTDYKQEKTLLERIDAVGEQLDAERKRLERSDPQKIKQLRDELAQLQKQQEKFVIKDEIDTIYSRNGAEGFNASTGDDLTTYQVSLPANRMELWARVESDRLLNPVLREFYSERDVVMEEYRQSYATKPDHQLMTNFLATAFIAHPYRVPIIGWESDLQYLTKKETLRFFTSHYVPNNAVLAIVGDIKVDETMKILETYFERLASRPLPETVITREPVQLGERHTQVVLDAEPRVLIGYHKPTLPSIEDYTFDIIDALLSNGVTSRLYTALVLDKKIAISVSTSNGEPGARYPNLFVIEALPRPPHTTAVVISAVYKEIERLKIELVTAHELQKIKHQLRASFIRGLASNAGLASQLSYFQIICNDWRYIETHEQIIEKINASDIRKVARQYLTPANRTVAVLVKKAAAD